MAILSDSKTDTYCIQHSPIATVQKTHLLSFWAVAQNSPELNSNDDEI